MIIYFDAWGGKSVGKDGRTAEKVILIAWGLIPHIRNPCAPFSMNRSLILFLSAMPSCKREKFSVLSAPEG
jgi:hypothetical protein